MPVEAKQLFQPVVLRSHLLNFRSPTVDIKNSQSSIPVEVGLELGTLRARGLRGRAFEYCEGGCVIAWDYYPGWRRRA